MRSDLNVPLDDEGNITDPGRITASVPTLNALAEAGAKVVVTAHLGRPGGAPDPKYSLKPVAAALGEELGRHVQLAGDVVGPERCGYFLANAFLCHPVTPKFSSQHLAVSIYYLLTTIP